MKLPFLNVAINIPAASAHAYISQYRICQSLRFLSWFSLYSELLLTRVLLNQWFLLANLKSSHRKFYHDHHDLVNRYGISVSQMYVFPSMSFSDLPPDFWLESRRVPLVEQQLQPFWSTWVHTRFVGFVLLIFLFFVQCFVDHCMPVLNFYSFDHCQRRLSGR